MTDAARFLSSVPEFASIVQWAGPRTVGKPVAASQRYTYLVRSVVYQQLAGSAAAAIFGRLNSLLGEPSPENVLAANPDDLRAVGLSGAKARTITAISQAVSDGELQFSRHGRLSDEQVTRELVAITGIGPWTAQMYLMSALRRPDVWPALDLGVRQGWSILHNIEPAISIKDIASAADHLAPYRSDVAWYCWRAVDRFREG